MKKHLFTLLALLAILGVCAAPSPADAAYTYSAWEFATYAVNSAGATKYGVADESTTSGDTTWTTGVTVDTASSHDPYSTSAGVSPMVVRQGPDVLAEETTGLLMTVDLKATTRVFALEILDMDPTALNSHWAWATGTTDWSSGSTGTWVVKTTSVDTEAAWAAAGMFTVIQGVAANSGTSAEWISFEVDPTANYLRMAFLPSGITPFGAVPVRLHELPAGSNTTLIKWPEQQTAVAASGVSGAFTSATSGGTGFWLPPGAEWFSFVANGDNVPFSSTAGVEATSSGRIFPDEKDLVLERDEIIDLGLGGTGGAASTLTMTPYSRRPY